MSVLIRPSGIAVGAIAALLAGAAGLLASAGPAAALASPTLVTKPSPAEVTLKAAAAPRLTDSAVLSGGSSPTGTITFTLFFNGGSTPFDIETVTVNGDGTYATPAGFTLPVSGAVTGTYQWDATYSGDANNGPVSETGDPGEQVVVTGASPVLTTTPNPARVTLGSVPRPLRDSARLAGGYHETGTITFTLFFDGGGTPFDIETVTVNGNGTYVTPAGFTLPASQAPGTYQWDATYSGDANNGPVSDTGDPGERVVVTKASPAITTRPGRTVVIGSALSDSAKLTSAASPTGTITFRLYDSHGHVVYTDHVKVSGNGSYTTAAGDHRGGYIPAIAGIYQWVAAYSGDGRNNAVASRKGDEPEMAVNGFGGFLSPPQKSTLKPGSTVSVKFRFTNTTGRPIAAAIAAKLAAAHDVTATLSGPGISLRSVSCSWNSVHQFFQCNIRSPKGIRTGRANPYLITALENVGAGSLRAPAIAKATTPNPEIVFF